MNRTFRRGSSSKSRPTNRPSKTTTNVRKPSTKPRGARTGKRQRGRVFGVALVLNVLLLALAGALGYRLVALNRTLEDRTSQIQMLQSQVPRDRTRESEERGPSVAQNYTPRQQTILKKIVNTPDIAQWIPQEPSLGGQWRCFSEEQVFFLDHSRVAFTYEDGHTMGAAIVEVRDPQKPSTWKVIWSGPL